MKKMLALSFLFTLIVVTGSRAETTSVLTGGEPVKIAILSMGVYNVVGSGEGLGAATTLGQETEATKDDKALAEGFDFKEVVKHGLEQYKAKLSGVRKWQVVSARELGKDEAIAKFAVSLKDLEKKIPGTVSETWTKRWTSADDLPLMQVMWVGAVTSDDYTKGILEVAKQFCADAGVDGVWLQSNYLGYGTQGASKFFSKLSMGSGSATAMVSVVYVLIDKEGQIVFSTGKTADQYRSEASFMMVGGAKAIDKEMMKYQMDALSVSAKAVAEKAGK